MKEYKLCQNKAFNMSQMLSHNRVYMTTPIEWWHNCITDPEFSPTPSPHTFPRFQSNREGTQSPPPPIKLSHNLFYYFIFFKKKNKGLWMCISNPARNPFHSSSIPNHSTSKAPQCQLEFSRRTNTPKRRCIISKIESKSRTPSGTVQYTLTQIEKNKNDEMESERRSENHSKFLNNLK